MSKWVKDPNSPSIPSPGALSEINGIEHKNGIPWHEAKLPFWIHRCKPQTRGWMGYFRSVDRCACGAVRRDEGHWFEKNERRKS